MAGMVIQHNINAMGANNRIQANVLGTKKATEKLSSGLKINRAGDNAAGLAISEKMRSQMRGLTQATNNAQDGISLIQTAEGGLNETHAILQRIRELAVQSSNGTYQNETDREAMDLEVGRLKEEVDRIASATEYNKIKLLNGELGGSENTTSKYGALYGKSTSMIATVGAIVNTTANISGAVVNFTIGASGTTSGENAVFSQDGLTVTVNLVAGKHYSDSEINDLIKNATQDKSNATGLTQAPAQITVSTKDNSGITMTAAGSTGGTVAGVRSGNTVAASVSTLVGTGSGSGAIKSADEIKFTANTYGAQKESASILKEIVIKTDADVGKETVDVTTKFAQGTTAPEIELHLATGKAYTEKDLHNILAKAGYDYEVTLSDSNDPDGSSNEQVYFNVADSVGVTVALDDGAGLAKDATPSGEGLTFQIGANGTADQRVNLNINNMSSSAIGIGAASVKTVSEANKTIEDVDDAIKTVSMQRSELGALQNRLEYTVNNLTVTNENTTASESQIRDTDMASEMINYTKNNILTQAAQSMLAQANQAPQQVLQLLG